MFMQFNRESWVQYTVIFYANEIDRNIDTILRIFMQLKLIHIFGLRGLNLSAKDSIILLYRYM
jgi:hypothetical protein